MVISKNSRAHKILSGHFQRRLVEKRYFAVVEGSLKRISERLSRRSDTTKKKDSGISQMTANRRNHAFAFLSAGRTQRFLSSNLLPAEPISCASTALISDTLLLATQFMGDADSSRLCLHAYRLCFWHPSGNRRLEFETKLPDEMN